MVLKLKLTPLPPVAKDFISGMGRTNDAIIYGGVVQLIVDGPENDLIDLSKKSSKFIIFRLW